MVGWFEDVRQDKQKVIGLVYLNTKVMKVCQLQVAVYFEIYHVFISLWTTKAIYLFDCPPTKLSPFLSIIFIKACKSLFFFWGLVIFCSSFSRISVLVSGKLLQFERIFSANITISLSSKFLSQQLLSRTLKYSQKTLLQNLFQLPKEQRKRMPTAWTAMSSFSKILISLGLKISKATEQQSFIDILVTFVNKSTGMIYFIVIFYFGYIFNIWAAIGMLFSSIDSFHVGSESIKYFKNCKKLSKLLVTAKARLMSQPLTEVFLSISYFWIHLKASSDSPPSLYSLAISSKLTFFVWIE